MVINEDVKFTLVFADNSSVAVSSESISAFSFSSQAVSGNTFDLGSVCSAQITSTFKLINVTSYRILGGTMQVYILKNNSWVKLGVFNIVSASRYRDIITVSASDNMILLDSSAFAVGEENSKVNIIADYFKSEKSVYDILNYAVSQAGLTLGNSKDDIQAMPNGLITSELSTETHADANIRDWVSWCASVLGGFAYADENGYICIGHFETESSAEFSAAYISADTSETADFLADKFDISITTYDENWYKTYTVTDEKETLINIDFSDNPIAQGYYYLCCQRYSDEHSEGEDSPRTLKMYEFTEAVWNAVGNLPIRPCKLAIASDNILHIGQHISVQNTDGDYVDTLITSLSWQIGDLQKINCIGEDTRLISKVRQRSELKRISEALKTDINEAQGRNITQAEFDAMAAENKLIEGKIYNIIG